MKIQQLRQIALKMYNSDEGFISLHFIIHLIFKGQIFNLKIQSIKNLKTSSFLPSFHHNRVDMFPKQEFIFLEAQFFASCKSELLTWLQDRYPHNSLSLVSSLKVDNTQTTKEKMGKLDLTKIENLCSSKDTQEAEELTVRICKPYIW